MYDYESYHFSKNEFAGELLRGILQVIFTGALFFHSWVGCLFLSPLLFLILKKRHRVKQKKKLNELRIDFRELTLSIAGSLHAGYSMEQAVSIALEDMKRLYPGMKRPMIDELIWMKRNLEMNVMVEQLFDNLAVRSGLEEIRSFASILSIVRSQGGNLVKISREAAEHIGRKIQVQMEIEQVIAGKKLEKKIMFFMPYFILIYLQLTNSEYLNPLFYTLYGNCCMALFLVVIYVADWWADKLTEISV